MKKRIICVLLVLVMLFAMLQEINMTIKAADAPQYEKAILNMDLSKIRAVGHQASGSSSCSCFALAYCTTILDNKVHSFHEYNQYGNNQYTVNCYWHWGDFVNGHYPSNIKEAYKIIYNEVVSGNPVIVKVNGSPQHYVAVVGVENVTTYESLSESNFLILDPAGSVFDVQNMGGQGYYLLKDANSKYQIVYNGTGKTVSLNSVVYTCKHNYNNVGVCTSTCKKEFDFNATFSNACMGVYTVTLSDGIYLRPDKPYSAAPASSTKIKYGTEVEVLGSVYNAPRNGASVGNKWYKVSYKGEIGYTSADNLTFKRYEAQSISCTVTSPAEGASVPKASYPIAGTVTSKYPLKEVRGYIDGHEYVCHDYNLGTVTTLDLQGSLLNELLDFASLQPGWHTLTITAKDIFHDELITVCTRNFVTVTSGSACSHSYSSYVSQEPTCTASGVRTYTCSKCGASYTESIPSLGGHSFDSYTVNREPTCITSGIRTYTCSVCGVKTTEAIPATGVHSYYEMGRVEATCTEAGSVTYTCYDCGNTYTETLYPDGESHSYYLSNAVDPTCAQEGYYLYACRYCNYSFYEYIPATEDHDYGSYIESQPTCVGPGTIKYICRACGDSYTEDYYIPGNHIYEKKVVEPTCTAEGFTVYDCRYCNEMYFADYVPATGHVYANEGCVQPTETASGMLYIECISCGEDDEVVLPVLNAEDYEYKVLREPTESSDGVGEYVWKNSSYGSVRFRVSIPKITVKVSSISIYSLPAKTKYYVGESLNTSGLSLIVTYTDGGYEIVDEGYTVSGFSSSIVGIKEITVTYEGKQAKFFAEIVERDLSVVQGDINQDGVVTSVDSNYIKRALAGKIYFEPGSKEALSADVNGDGKISAVDANILKRIVAGAA